eukprot:CAMPEP_0173426520 /NCGR_PEP_ID=MMETSP1357-20121228/5959_1 /TAXON_ID=77926 /ORGANISM="Hemiselmis rufescens, Strain PCC563" /LENGTH=73 /DNA_ID=CAMNT_0014390199 /DNA_START=146 /DNA_END=367 /DNA_ORIENTATION=-
MKPDTDRLPHARASLHRTVILAHPVLSWPLSTVFGLPTAVSQAGPLPKALSKWRGDQQNLQRQRAPATWRAMK